MKENFELADGFKVFTELGIKVTADGKIDLSDLTSVVDLAMQFSKIKEAFTGLGLLDDEFKAALDNNDEESIKTFAVKWFAISKDIQTIMKNMKKDAPVA